LIVRSARMMPTSATAEPDGKIEMRDDQHPPR
jgi:hypothetical protein